jgi:tRNA 2-thiocytidine biosynthesis protein TtcA
MIETLFLNMFHGGRLKAMPPKLLTDDRRHIVIRPLAYCPEADIARYARYREFPIIPCTLCGSQANLQRSQIKDMVQTWEKQWPGRTETLFRSLQNVAPSQLADPTLFDFGGLDAERLIPSEGDGPSDRDGMDAIESDLEAEFNPAMALFAEGLPPLSVGLGSAIANHGSTADTHDPTPALG